MGCGSAAEYSSNQPLKDDFGFSLNGVIFLVTFWASIASDLGYRGEEWEDQ
jgi:hypothetical protein